MFPQINHPLQDPYTDGKYHGVLEFPASFPMAPPAIRMLTPSMRFETNQRICMSMSDYHPELWVSKLSPSFQFYLLSH